MAELSGSVADRADALSKHLAGAEEDLRLATRNPDLARMLGATGPLRVSAQAHLVEQWKALAESRGRYVQIRYIDEDGDERIRIERDGGEYRSTPVPRLQNKARRYYFIETMTLDPGQVYVTSMDLNQEHGRIERPFLPVVRYATPVADREGRRAGMVILNLDARPLLEIARRTSREHAVAFLVDRQGYFLAHPDPAKRWGAARDLGHGANIRDRYPDLWQNISGPPGRSEELRAGSAVGKPEVFEPADTLVAIDTLAASGASQRIAGASADTSMESPAWFLINEVPKDAVFAPIHRFRLYFGLGFGGFLILLLGMGAVVTHNLTHPLAQLHRGVVRMGSGQSSLALDIAGGAEVRELAAEFNQMAARVDQAQASLERRVQEATHSLDERNRQLRRLYEAGVSLMGELTVESVLQSVTDAGRVVVDARHAALGLLDEGGEISDLHVSGLEDAEPRPTFENHDLEGMFQKLYGLEKAIRINDPHDLSEGWAMPAGHPLVANLLGVPIQGSDRTIGFLSLANKVHLDGFTAQDEEMVGLLASLAATVIENARLLAQEKATIERLRELDQLKSDFVDTVSHQLRSPVAVIQGYCDLLTRRGADMSPNQNRELLTAVAGQSACLSVLVEDMLTVSRIDSGRQEYAPRPLSLDSLVEEVVSEARARHGRSIVHRRQGSEPLIVHGDGLFLRQALQNLIDNGLKYSPPESEVTVALETDPWASLVKVLVADQGIGIEADQVGQIFDKFYRVRNDFTETVPGTGLGLYITKQIVSAHSGEINVESEFRGGSRFIVTLPLASSPGLEQASA